MRPTIPNFVIGPFRRILGSNSDVLASSEEQVSAVRWTLPFRLLTMFTYILTVGIAEELMTVIRHALLLIIRIRIALILRVKIALFLSEVFFARYNSICRLRGWGWRKGLDWSGRGGDFNG